MHVTSKGQVTIPQEIRNRLGLLSHTEVEFERVGDHARIRKSSRAAGRTARAHLTIEALRGTADIAMTTDEIMSLTRADVRVRRPRK